MSQTENLSLLGKKTAYRQDYAPEVLEAFENKHQGNDYWVTFDVLSSQASVPSPGSPTATIRIDYIPDVKMVESKSLKIHLFSFRNHGASIEMRQHHHERPDWTDGSEIYQVTGIFTAGGISIYPYANYGRPVHVTRSSPNKGYSTIQFP